VHATSMFRRHFETCAYAAVKGGQAWQNCNYPELESLRTLSSSLSLVLRNKQRLLCKSSLRAPCLVCDTLTGLTALLQLTPMMDRPCQPLLLLQVIKSVSRCGLELIYIFQVVALRPPDSGESSALLRGLRTMSGSRI
jgi:hypothetical protein